jgi:hypothetical protein
VEEHKNTQETASKAMNTSAAVQPTGLTDWELTGTRRAAKAKQKHRDAGQEPPPAVERAEQELAQQTSQGRDFGRDKSGGSCWTEKPDSAPEKTEASTAIETRSSR